MRKLLLFTVSLLSLNAAAKSNCEALDVSGKKVYDVSIETSAPDGSDSQTFEIDHSSPSHITVTDHNGTYSFDTILTTWGHSTRCGDLVDEYADLAGFGSVQFESGNICLGTDISHLVVGSETSQKLIYKLKCSSSVY